MPPRFPTQLLVKMVEPPHQVCLWPTDSDSGPMAFCRMLIEGIRHLSGVASASPKLSVAKNDVSLRILPKMIIFSAVLGSEKALEAQEQRQMPSVMIPWNPRALFASFLCGERCWVTCHLDSPHNY